MRGDEPGAWMSFLKFVNSDDYSVRSEHALKRVQRMPTAV